MKDLVRSSIEETLNALLDKEADELVNAAKYITEALWCTKVSRGTISNLNKKAYEYIETWRNRPIDGGNYPYVFVDGIFLKRCWGGEYENVSILIAMGVNVDGYREIIGAAEGMKEDKESWKNG